MITGIIVTVLFIIVCLRLTKKKAFAKVHIPASAALIVATAAHIIAAFNLLKSRPAAVIVTGTAAFVFIIIACFTGIKRAKKAHIISALIAALLIIVHAAFNITGVVAYQNQIGNIVITGVDISEIPDGLYIGECNATYIYVKVRVTVKSGEITAIELAEHRNERGKAAEAIISSIIARQRTDVDAVTGATNSSVVIKKAVENALRDFH